MFYIFIISFNRIKTFIPYDENAFLILIIWLKIIFNIENSDEIDTEIIFNYII